MGQELRQSNEGEGTGKRESLRKGNLRNYSEGNWRGRETELFLWKQKAKGKKSFKPRERGDKLEIGVNAGDK